MKLRQIVASQVVPIGLAEAWQFFSDPWNLGEITPPSLGFHMTNDPPHEIHRGQIIGYTIRPLLNLPLLWVTEITDVREGEYFIDEQRVGPYRLWHHEHRFRSVGGGTEIHDHVQYVMPCGLLGELAYRLVVQKQLNAIFDFRREALQTRFAAREASKK